MKSFPELHDKIEFDVAITTYSLDMDERVELLIGDVLTEDEKMEFKQEHRKQTQYLIKSDGRGSLKQAINKINTLESKQKQLSNTDQPCLSSLFTMIDDCIQLGTTPFSILARHGFIARNMLLSLENKGIITHDEVNQIQASIHTVASDLVDDLRTLQIEGGYSEFMERYGHLRPGTYDVMSHRYDQMTDFFSGIAPTQLEQCKSKFEFSQIQLDQLSDLLEENCFNDLGADELLNYVYEATIGRELGKFIFTRSVSDMLEMIANFAEKNGLSRSEISHVPLSSILKLAKNTHEQTAEEILRDISEQEVEKHEISAAIRLPQLLTDQAGVYVVPFQVSHPNFITRKKIIAPCQTLNRDSEGICLNGKVVLIEGADPGFDWIFSQKIAGLITKYGGANSHMAIRCAEFGIPAAIGCGEQYFDMLLKTNKVHLDCSTGLINLLH